MKKKLSAFEDKSKRRPMNVHVTDAMRNLIAELQKYGLSQAEVIERGLAHVDEEAIRSGPSNDFRKGGKKQKVFNITQKTWDRINDLHIKYDVPKTSLIELAFIRFAAASAQAKAGPRNLILQQFSDQDLIDELRRRGIEI